MTFTKRAGLRTGTPEPLDGSVSRDTGFLQLRRGIWEHIRDGRLSLSDSAVYIYIASQADTRTGVWTGSAGALAGELSISPRLARRFIERLTKGDYIRRFPVPGRHVCYPILVHKFLLTDGEHRGEQLNAIASTSPDDLRYSPSEQRGEHMGEHVSSQKRLENGDKRKELKQTPRFALPEWVPQPAWDDFIEMRGSLRAAPTERAKALLVKKLQNFKNEGQDPKTVLEQSIERSWKGVFPVKESIGAKPDANAMERKNRVAAGFAVN